MTTNFSTPIASGVLTDDHGKSLLSYAVQ